ncbi:MAG: asparagine--tRNA ligase, partial [Polyangiaceae bacterium]|nr:asparagine--tRNA ligase [Polyangiaceae bacterium]
HAAVARMRHTLALAVHRCFDERGFYWVNTPILTGSDAEGAGQLFRVSTLDLLRLPRTAEGGIDFRQDFFGREAFLTVSGQLNVESYSNTPRHLAEFWMIEPEIAFADLGDNADLAEEFLKHLFRTALEERHEELRLFAQRLEKSVIERLERLVGQPFVRMSYDEAIAILERAGRSFEFPVRWGIDLQTEHERYLTEEHVRGPVVVMNYPEA